MFTIKNKMADSENSRHTEYCKNISKLFTLIMLIVLPALIFFPSLGQMNLKADKTGKTFRDCEDCPEMIVIPAGSFMMGAADNEPGSYPEEKPQRKVSIKKFACGKFDITIEQWTVFVKETNRPVTGGCSWSGLPADTSAKPWEPIPSASWNHIGFMQDSSHPVVCITWYDVQDYIDWLSKKTGFTYRLLSEAEWEYAARAGTTTPFPWGLKASHEYANYGADSGYTGLAFGRDRWISTSPVGSFPPNAFGLYDMLGNVNQYVEDCFAASYSGLPTDGLAYKVEVQLKMTGDLAAMNGTSSCAYRMVRGGNYGDPPAILRCAYRNWNLKTYSSAALGFRVARRL